MRDPLDIVFSSEVSKIAEGTSRGQGINSLLQATVTNVSAYEAAASFDSFAPDRLRQNREPDGSRPDDTGGLLSRQLMREPNPAAAIDDRHVQHGSPYSNLAKVHEAAFAEQRGWLECRVGQEGRHG